jgi:hypothetical protein
LVTEQQATRLWLRLEGVRFKPPRISPVPQFFAVIGSPTVSLQPLDPQVRALGQAGVQRRRAGGDKIASCHAGKAVTLGHRQRTHRSA